MKIVVASDSYKGCLSSEQANETIKKGIKRYNADFEVLTFPIGDGGEGTSLAFEKACQGVHHTCIVKDAYYKDISVAYTIIEDGNTAVIDVASVIGLNMYLKEKRRVMYATSYGVGQLILDCLNQKVKKIIIGLGGSSTNDGGMGLLNALGVKFYNQKHEYLKTSCKSLKDVTYIDFNQMVDLSNVEIVAACDVDNYLLGESGATFTYGKQKGLKPSQMSKVDANMAHYVEIFKKYNYDLNAKEGSGAAGGIGAVLLNVLNGKKVKALDLLLSYNGIEAAIKDSDLVITGEGQSDEQTLYGKVPVGILALTKKYQVPCICLSGALGLGYDKLYEVGFIGIYSIADRAMGFLQALDCAEEKLEKASYTIIKTIDYWRKK